MNPEEIIEKELIGRIKTARTLEDVDAIKAAMRSYSALYPERAKGALSYGMRLLWPLDESLHTIEAAGIPMDEFYRLSAERDEQFMAGEPLTPWPEEWSPVLINS